MAVGIVGSLMSTIASVQGPSSADLNKVYEQYIQSVRPLVEESNKPFIEQKIGGVPIVVIVIGAIIATMFLMKGR